ncbi:hypothetical protein ACIFOT_26755 [Neobacillus sp. NRS-1170]|uniref:hypothetical protein n=1 Tax=Neobacillus sp. NRS-1170 TaxID=3233898 RepID=UPI003D2D439B
MKKGFFLWNVIPSLIMILVCLFFQKEPLSFTEILSVVLLGFLVGSIIAVIYKYLYVRNKKQYL